MRFKALTIGILTTIIISGCALLPTEKEAPPAKIEQLITEAKVTKKTVSLHAETSKTEDDEIEVILTGKNPEGKEISGVKVWLTYNPNQLEAIKLDSADSPFDLDAPGENVIDQDTGVIKIGKSKTGDPVSENSFLIAKLTLKKLAKGLTTIDVFNYQEDESGNSQIITIIDEKPTNILKKPPIPFVSL